MKPSETAHPHYWIGAIMIVTLMGTALVSPLYPLYREAWHLTPGEVTQVYVIYMLGALLSLLVFGRLADRWGYRKVIAAALCLCLIGTCLSMLSRGFYLFSFARFLVGIAASLTTTAGTVALVALTPERNRSTLTMMISLFIAAGFGLGPLVGGAAGQWAPEPLVTAHIPSLILLIGCFAVFIFLLPRPAADGRLTLRDLLPRLSWAAPEDSLRFGLACCLPFIVFGVFGLYASMAPMMIRDFTGLEGPMVSGGTIGAILVVSVIVQVRSRHAPPRRSALIALALIAAGNLCLLANMTLGSLWLFLLGGLFVAVAHGLGLLASSTVLYAVSRPDNRGALTSTYWAIGYSGAIFPLLLMGWIADTWGMPMAVSLFCATMAVLAIAVLVLIVAMLGRSPRNTR